mmetsp:Transcript_14659/g.46651  ORF Transcript_14659/g.46651 Transcript_14659/m.46651 type:complete len:293 (-) Transcript_14659:274-1152(-)
MAASRSEACSSSDLHAPLAASRAPDSLSSCSFSILASSLAASRALTSPLSFSCSPLASSLAALRALTSPLSPPPAPAAAACFLDSSSWLWRAVTAISLSARRSCSACTSSSSSSVLSAGTGGTPVAAASFLASSCLSSVSCPRSERTPASCALRASISSMSTWLGRASLCNLLSVSWASESSARREAQVASRAMTSAGTGAVGHGFGFSAGVPSASPPSAPAAARTVLFPLAPSNQFRHLAWFSFPLNVTRSLVMALFASVRSNTVSSCSWSRSCSASLSLVVTFSFSLSLS